MRVQEARCGGQSLQIDPVSVRPGQRLDFFIFADCNDSTIPDRDGLCDSILRIHGQDIAINENTICRRRISPSVV